MGSILIVFWFEFTVVGSLGYFRVSTAHTCSLVLMFYFVLLSASTLCLNRVVIHHVTSLKMVK